MQICLNGRKMENCLSLVFNYPLLKKRKKILQSLGKNLGSINEKRISYSLNQRNIRDCWNITDEPEIEHYIL
jgi:hypothetical protein